VHKLANDLYLAKKIYESSNTVILNSYSHALYWKTKQNLKDQRPQQK